MKETVEIYGANHLIHIEEEGDSSRYFPMPEVAFHVHPFSRVVVEVGCGFLSGACSHSSLTRTLSILNLI